MPNSFQKPVNDQVEARSQKVEEGLQAETAFGIEFYIANLKGVCGQMRSLVVELLDGGGALGTAEAEARCQLVGDRHERTEGRGPCMEGAVYVQARVGERGEARVEGGVVVPGGGLEFDIAVGRLVIQPDVEVLLSRGRGEDKTAQFQVSVLKTRGENSVLLLVSRVQVEFELTTVVMKEELGSDAAAGLVLDVVVIGPGESHLGPVYRMAVEPINRLPSKTRRSISRSAPLDARR